jgi:hypothetical protein
MKTLAEIIEQVKDGGKPEYDELRYALLAMDFLNADLNLFVMMDLYGKDKLQGWDKKRYEMKYEHRQKAFQQDPKIYVGGFDPDSPGYQEERAIHKRIYDKFMTMQAGKGE